MNLSKRRARAGLGKAALKSAFGAAVAMEVLGAGQAQAIVVTVAPPDATAVAVPGPILAATGTTPFYGPGPGVSRETASTVRSLHGKRLSQLDIRLPSTESILADILQEVRSSAPPDPGAPIFLATITSGDGKYTTKSPFDLFLVRVPGPLPALGLAAAFGFSRKLRKRFKASTNAVSSTYSL
jgi:hypothetical protein